MPKTEFLTSGRYRTNDGLSRLAGTSLVTLSSGLEARAHFRITVLRPRRAICKSKIVLQNVTRDALQAPKVPVSSWHSTSFLPIIM